MENQDKPSLLNDNCLRCRWQPSGWFTGGFMCCLITFYSFLGTFDSLLLGGECLQSLTPLSPSFSSSSNITDNPNNPLRVSSSPSASLPSSPVSLSTPPLLRSSPFSFSSSSSYEEDESREEIQRRFQASGIQTFLDAYQEATRPRARQLVLICHAGCGGIADRVKGIPYAMGLALMMGRQFVIHPSLLTNGDLDFPTEDFHNGKKVHAFIDGYCSDAETMQKLLLEEEEEIVSFRPVSYVKANCERPLDPLFYLANLPSNENKNNDSHNTIKNNDINIASTTEDKKGGLHDSYILTTTTTLQKIQDECQAVPHLCGAAVIHQINCFREGLALARHTVEHLPMLSFRNYTALHIRAGGSTIDIGGGGNGIQAKAIPWSDAHVSPIAQAWINAFRDPSHDYNSCKQDLAVISDSTRAVSEIRFAAQDRIMVTNCCQQPLHRDRYVGRKGFFLQEAIDLFIMARSSLLIAGNGGFGLLGRYWLGLEGPQFVVAKTVSEIHSAFQTFLENNGCKEQ